MVSVAGISRLIVAVFTLLASAGPAHAQLLVAAASDLQPVLPDIAARFERATGQPVRVSFGSSGQFVAQIQNGAPFDVFLSADDQYVRQVVASGHADGSSVAPYAAGRLAIWSRTDRHLGLSRGVSALGDPGIRRIAIANPDHAPYGRAAVDALTRSGVYDLVKPKLVLGESVAQAAQFAQTGNADVAIVALSLTMAPAMQQAGAAVEVPQEAFGVIRQTGVVLSRSTRTELGLRFLAFLRQPDIAGLLHASGFGPLP